MVKGVRGDERTHAAARRYVGQTHSKPEIGSAGKPRRTEEQNLHATALSVADSPLSMIAKASASSASVMHSGGLVKKPFQRTKV